MSLIGLIVVLVVLALILWILPQVGVPEPVGKIIRVLLVVGVCLYLLQAFGFLPALR